MEGGREGERGERTWERGMDGRRVETLYVGKEEIP